MDRRGGASFAIFLVLNPIFILFFQNCSVIPSKTSRVDKSLIVSRSISSVTTTSSCRLVSNQACPE